MQPQEAHQVLPELPGSLGHCPTLNALLGRNPPNPAPLTLPEHEQGSSHFWVPLIWGPPWVHV